MKKILGSLIAITFLSGCVESMALLGPASTGAGYSGELGACAHGTGLASSSRSARGRGRGARR